MKAPNAQNLLHVINRMRSMVEAEPQSPACQEINWRQPHHYGADQKDKLADINQKLAACLQKTLQYYCDEAFSVRADGLSEHFAGSLAAEVKQSRKNWFFLPVMLADKSQVGFLELSFESAASLIGQMLRDPEAQIGQNGEMSALEQSILLDILTSLTDALVDELALYQIKLSRAEQLIYGEWPVRFRELQDMIRFGFSAECGQTGLSVGLCLLDEVADPALGLVRAVHSPEEIKKYPERVVGRMQEASMQVTAQLSSAMMTLSDILSLEKGDIVVLGQKSDCPLVMLVNGQMCFKAWPARHNGRIAVQMTASE